MTTEAKAVEAALEIARHVARGYRPKLAEADRMAETLLALSARVERLVDALQHFADCDLNERNCASLEVATRRIQNIARAALTPKAQP